MTYTNYGQKFGASKDDLTIHPASLCSVSIRKIHSSPAGDQPIGRASAFHFRDNRGFIWLVTNWHALTARRPDDPGFLLGNAGNSPHKIEVMYPSATKGITIPLECKLYDDGKPVWKQYGLSQGNDIAAIQVSPPKGALFKCVQDFSEISTKQLRPGAEVVIVGFPIEQGPDVPFPLWKKAMIASEPGVLAFEIEQGILDTSGTPGMSGAPVYEKFDAISVTKAQRDKYNEFSSGKLSALDFINSLDSEKLKPMQGLALLGIYAGATGKSDSGLERLTMGRMMWVSAIEKLILGGEPGENPFPPDIST